MTSNVVPCIHGLQRQPMAAMFVDLDCFMRMCLDFPAEDVLLLIGQFQRIVTDAVSSFGGEVNGYQGDGALATFGKSAGRTDCATRALGCARALIDEIGTLSLRETDGTPRSISASIGLQYGQVCSGTISISNRFGPTLVGDAVNVAVRLEQHARSFGTRIVVGNELMQRARCECASGGAELAKFVEAGTLSLGGRTDPVNVWIQAEAGGIVTESLRNVALA
jgi:adenylate cyclase